MNSKLDAIARTAAIAAEVTRNLVVVGPVIGQFSTPEELINT